MPLEPADLKSLEAYSEKCKQDVNRVTKDGTPFWVYKDFPILDKGKSVKTVLVVLQNRTKVSTQLLSAKLVSTGHCTLQDGKVSFAPEKGKVPYGLLKKQEIRFFGTKKIVIPPGAENDEGDQDLSAAPGDGTKTAVSPAPGNPPDPVDQTNTNVTPKPVPRPQPQPWVGARPVVRPQPVVPQQPPTKPQPPPKPQAQGWVGAKPTAAPQTPPVQPGQGRADFTRAFEEAKPTLLEARQVTVEMLLAPAKAVLAELPKISSAMNDASKEGDWAHASYLLAKLLTGAKMVVARKREAFEDEHSKVMAQVQEALAVQQTDLKDDLKALQGPVAKARDAVAQAAADPDPAKAQAALTTLKAELKKFQDGKRDQDAARNRYADEYSKLKAKIDAVNGGPSAGALAALKKTALDAHGAMSALAQKLDFTAASAAVNDVSQKADAYLTSAGAAEVTRAKAVTDARNDAMTAARDNINKANTLPATAADDVERTAAADKALAKSKGLQDLVASAKQIDQLWKTAVLSGAPDRIAASLPQMTECIQAIDKFQQNHKQTGDQDDKKKFAAAEQLRNNLQSIKQGLAGLADSLRYVASVEDAGDDGATKAIAVLAALQKTAAAPEVRTMLAHRRDVIETGLILSAGADQDRVREVARMAGGDKEKAFYESRFAQLAADLRAADDIKTATSRNEKAIAEYREARGQVDAAAGFGNYSTALSALPRLSQAAKHLVALESQAAAANREKTERRNKASQAFKAAHSPAEMEEIAKRMGGEVQAAFDRQKTAGPMTQQADGSKAAQAAHASAKLQDAGKARNAEIARSVADRLVNDQGEFEVAGLYLNDPDELAKALGAAPHSKQVARALKRLRDEPALQEKLTSIGKPDPKNPAAQMIRASLGLAPGDEVTEAHARKAALSAMLAEMRQSDVGSCYATGTAIRVHDSDPGRMLDDLKEMIETGKLTRNVQQGGKVVRLEVPVTTPVSTTSLDKKATVGRDGNLRKAGGEDATRQPLANTPSVTAAMKALGITPAQTAQKANAALAALRASKVQAGLSAVAKSLPETIDDPSNAGKKIANLKRKELLAKIPALLASKPDNATAKQALQDEIAGFPDGEKTAILAAFDNHFKAFITPEHEFTADDILKQAAMSEAQVTEADLVLRDRMRELGVKLREVRVKDPDGTTDESNKLLEEYSDTSAKYTPKIAGLARYDAMVGAAQNAYLGQEENRLLRTWEYTTTALAEQGIAQDKAPAMKNGAANAVDDILSNKRYDLIADGAEPAEVRKAQTALLERFKELWDENVRMGYDASQGGELAKDGSSSKGAFCLFDKAGIDDPTKQIPVNGKDSYTKLVEGLIVRAKADVLASESDKQMQNVVEKLGEAVADSAGKNPDSLVAAALTQIGSTKYTTPWAVVEGQQMPPTLTAYYGRDVTPASVKATDPEQITGWMLTQGRALMGNIPDKSKLTPETVVPMRGGPHVWNFRVGEPSVRKVLESPADANAFKAAEQAKFDAQKNTPLSPELTKILIGDAFSGWKNANDSITKFTKELPPNAKAADVVQKIKAHFDTTDPDFAPTAEKRAIASVMKNVAPPVAAAGGQLEAQVNATLKKLNLGPNEGPVKTEVMSKLVPSGNANPAPVPVTAIEKAIAKVLVDRDLRDDETSAAAEVCNAQKPGMLPGLPFGDSNWGGGDHHILFSMVRNPSNGQLEMWQFNEDGTGARQMKTEDWITDQPWEMVTDPAAVGGLVT
jgi:hypothetical protein